MSSIVVCCPHCFDPVFIEQLNCGIFRHAVLKHNREQIDPHAPKEECDKHVLEKTIYGCGKPFTVVKTGDSYVSEKCDYV